MLSGAAGLAACSAMPTTLGRRPNERVLRLVESGDVPAAGVVARRFGRQVFASVAGSAAGLETGGGAARAFLPTTKMRIASVSKVATALTALRLEQAGGVSLDGDIRGIFAGGFRHAAFPDVPITLAHLLGHRSGLRDPAVYWVAAPGRIEELFTGDMWGHAEDGPPGDYFAYCNFGYAIAATVLEQVSGERFDHLAERLVLSPLGLTAGFNWSGVARVERQMGATLYRKEADDWSVQADGLEALNASAPTSLVADGFDLAAYEIASNGTLFSPQGGLRASLDEMAVLVRAAATEPSLAEVQWRWDGANGQSDNGFFEVFGTGLQHHDGARALMPGGRLIGHAGEAYGLYSGAWHLPDLDAEIAFAVTGSPAGKAPAPSEHPGFLGWEWELLQAGLDGLLAAS
jgi:CubicO group peptidase (beta-lactamase class C family)